MAVSRLQVPLPEPVFMITVSHGSAQGRRAMVSALRFLLWGVPSLAVDCALAVADGGRHALWLTLAASFAVLAIAVLTVNAEAGDDSGTPGGRS